DVGRDLQARRDEGAQHQQHEGAEGQPPGLAADHRGRISNNSDCSSGLKWRATSASRMRVTVRSPLASSSSMELTTKPLPRSTRLFIRCETGGPRGVSGTA